MAIKKSKPKNSNGDGSIAYEKERNKWRACIYDPEGNRLRPRFDTKEQAEEWLIEKKNEFNKNTYIAPSNITVGEWYLEYLQTFVFQNVGEKTQSDYLSIASHYLPIANIRLQDLTPVDIQRLYNSIDLAANSKVKIHSLLKQAIDKAFALRMINFNPMLAVNSPSAERVPVEVYTEQEVQHILSIVKYSRHYSRYYPFVLTAVSTGARLGEILALKYHNILNRAIKIEHTIGTINGKMVERKPKTPAGRRIITIDGNLEKVCEIHGLILLSGQPGQRLGRTQNMFVARIARDVSVTQRDVAAAVLCDLGVVRHEDDRAPRGVELLEKHQHLETRPRIEIARRLVREDHRRVVDQRPGDGHALHLSARHLVALVQQAVAQPHGLQCRDGTLAPLGRLVLRVVHQRQLDVLDGRGLRQQVVVLEDEADLAVAQRRPLVLVHRAHRDAVEVVLPRRRRVEAAQRVEQRRLPGSRRTHDRHELPLADRERHPAQGVDRLVADPEIAPDLFQPDHFPFHGPISFCRFLPEASA